MKKTLRFFIASIVLAMFASTNLLAGPPAAPAGWKWEVVASLTDDFQDGWVNTNKWHKTNPYWGGRDPGRFKEYCVTESNGKLHLKNYYIHPTTQQVWVHTGFLASKSKTAFYVGYYSEAKIRGSKDGTVFGFWMSKPGSKQEIDVQEGVGFSGKPKYRYLGTYMRMNTHTHSGQVSPKTHNTGWNVGDGFHTYGVYWKGPQHIVMYYGGGNGTAFNHYPAQPFTGGMQLNLNSECQNWLGNPLPHRLNDNRYNYTSVEYIRTWKLVPKSGGGGQLIAMKNISKNKYVSSENGTKSMTCNRSSIGGWEKFTLVDLGGGKYAIKGNNGKYVSSENGSKPMNCNRGSVGAWEKFEFQHVSNQEYGIKANNGKYLGADMMCNQPGIANWSKFKITWGLKSGEIESIETAVSDLNVFPNPASDKINVSINSGNAENLVELYNIQGVKVLEKLINTNTESVIDVSELTKGIYLIKANNSIQRVVIE